MIYARMKQVFCKVLILKEKLMHQKPSGLLALMKTLILGPF